MKKAFFIFLFILLSMTIFGEISVSAILESSTGYLEEPLTLQVIVEGSEAPVISRLPEDENFSLQFMNSNTNTQQSVVFQKGNREVVVRQTHYFFYRLIPHKSGNLSIPAIEVMVDGKSYVTDELKLQVKKITALEDFKLEVINLPDACFPGELVRLHYKLSFRKSMRYLRLDPPFVKDSSFYIQPLPTMANSENGLCNLEMGEFLINATQDWKTLDDGTEISLLEFSLALIPREPGSFILDKTKLSFEAATASKEDKDFFGSRVNKPVFEKLIILSNSVELKVHPFPEKGKPANFSGLTGVEKISSEIVPVPNSWNAVFLLKLKLQDMFIPAHVFSLPSPGSLSGIEKDFFTASFWVPGRITEQTSEYYTLISPKRDSQKILPPLVLPVFNTDTKQYSSLKTEAVNLTPFFRESDRASVSAASEESSIALQFVIDCSGSMEAQKIMGESTANRLEMVVNGSREYIAGKDGIFPGLQQNLLGLTTFARYPQIRTSLSWEHGHILQQLAIINIVSDKNEDGTSIADALLTAELDISLLEAKEETSSKHHPARKAIVLITDGNDKGEGYSRLEVVLNKLEQNDINLYVISLSSEGWFFLVDRLGLKVKSPVPVPERKPDDLQSLCQVKKIPFWSVDDDDSLRAAFQKMQTLLEKRPGE